MKILLFLLISIASYSQTVEVYKDSILVGRDKAINFKVHKRNVLLEIPGKTLSLTVIHKESEYKWITEDQFGTKYEVYVDLVKGVTVVTLKPENIKLNTIKLYIDESN